MAWKQRPTCRSCQAIDAHDPGIRSQCEENFQSADLYVFLTFTLIVVSYSAFFLTGIHVDENYGARNRPHFVLHLDSCSVIDFRVMENQLVANWTAAFVLINKKNDTEIFIEPFDLLVFYKRTSLVSCASMAEPLVLKTKYQAVIEVEFSPEGCNKALSIDDDVLQEIEQDLKKGKISLDLNLDLEATRKGISMWDYRVELEPRCSLDLEFNYTSTRLSARPLLGTSVKNCRIPLPV